MQILNGRGLGIRKEKLYRVVQFDSIDEFLDQSKKLARPSEASHTRGDEYGGGFYNSKTYNEAWTTAHDGWVAERPKVEKHVTAIRERLAELVDPVSVRVYDIIGYEPDIDRFVSGEIECMWDDMMIEAPHQGRVFTVLLDNSLSSGQNKDEIIKRGAVVIALVEAFQLFGFELEVWVEQTVAPSRGSNGDKGQPDFMSTVCRIAKAGERPDINAIMYPLGNPDWLRRLIFGIEEGQPKDVVDHFGFNNGGGYGAPRQGAHHGQRLGASIEISLEHPDGRMVSDPVGWIVSQLEAQGVITDGA